MKIILIEDVENLGRRGEVVNVADGYARNFLIPKKWAMEATAGNLKFVENKKSAWLRQEAKMRDEAEGQARLIEQVVVELSKKAGEGDALYGSVTSMEIAEFFQSKGFEIDRRKIRLDQPIKHLGEFTVPVKLFHDVIASVKVVVTREGAAVTGSEGEA